MSKITKEQLEKFKIELASGEKIQAFNVLMVPCLWSMKARRKQQSKAQQEAA